MTGRRAAPLVFYAALLIVLGALARRSLADRPPDGDRPRAVAPPPAPDPRDAVARALAVAVTVEGDGVYGAGILVDPPAGLVLTAHHVVAEMRAPRVSFLDGASASARVIDSDATLDLALLEIGPQPGRTAPLLGDPTALRPGDPLYAVGCPRHLPFSVSRGILSFAGRSLDGARYLQTDLAINDGNSGGPVVDARGQLVAMTSFIYRRAEGLAFALPVAYAVERFPSLARLAQGGEAQERFRRWRR